MLYIADLRRMVQFIREVSFAAFVMTILLGYLAIPLRAIQWQMLLGYSLEITFFKSFKAICLGHIGNFILPMRGGELLRAFVLSRSTGTPLGKVLVSVFLSRVQDLPAIGMVMAATFLLVSVPPEALQRTFEILGVQLPRIANGIGPAAKSLGVTAALCAILLILCYLFIHPMLSWVRQLSTRLPNSFAGPLTRFLEGVAGGIHIVGEPRLFWGAQLISFLCWLIFALSPIPLLLAFSMDLKQAFLTALSKTAITTVAHLLPSAPGTVGTFHAFCLLSVLAVNPNMDKDAALAYVFLAHIISTLSPAIPGLMFVPSAWKDISAFRHTTHQNQTSSIARANL